MDLTEAEDIKKRWQEYTEELHKKDLHDPDNHDGVITHLEPDILQCEVKWALENITMNKASGDDGIPAQLFQILKNDAAINCCPQYASKFGKLSSGHRTGKLNFHPNPTERQCQRILYMAVYICQCYSLNLSHSFLPLLYPQIHSLHLCL